ncbi:phage tail tape measure protein [Virgibacillus litoralis]|uniref:TP901 family phage tail tape measure protein n=1 Tax=Virgibacillus litoralis TaxID=578221 RepID=A0ABS4HHA7_9BACI|nr:phage tail tape measure protein [Virgibacillus litoralis]MBP1950301.1 TP901 family phage tail tape measure protein [Virgibacillus litoralis]
MANREVIADLVAQVSLDGAKFNQGMGKVNRELKTVQEELKTARSRFKQTGDEVDFLGNKSQTLSGKLKLQKSQVDLLSKAYNESKENSGEFSKNTQNLARRLERANRELSETEHELKDVNRQLKNQPSKWTELGKSAETAGQKMMNAGSNMRQFGQAYTMGVTVPIVAGAGAVFKASMDFESAFTGVEKTVDGTKQQMDGLKESIRDMAQEIPASTTEISAIAESAGQLGIQTENIEDFTRVMADLGEATNLTSGQAATEFARFANIVGMSQDDFDKLGSVVVDLGNNLATTESEISEMALRLAGAGDQVGMTESEILSFSAALSSVGIRAEAGGSSFSKVMVEMQLAAEKGGDSLDNFAKVAGVSAEEFKQAYEQDATGAIMQFIEGLSTAEDRGLSAIGVLDEMGITEVRMRDALLRAAGASDVFSESLEIGSKAWKENIALTEEAEKRYATTESQLKIMWNRVKDLGITLGEALVPAVMDAIDAAEPFIEKIEAGADAFSKMNEEEQRSILKMVGFVAAVGPASIVLGGLTTTVGGALKIFGSLSKMLGAARGAGLLGRLAGLGVGGPVGWAIAGVTVLGTVVNALSKESSDLNDVNWDTVESMKAEVDQTDKLIAEFEKLEKKNRLATDEMLRYMDIMSELKETNNASVIKELKDEQAKLLEQSGLTNKEMDRFLELNGDIIEQAPGAKKAISEEGNAYAHNLAQLKKLNDEKRKQMMIAAEDELLKALENEAQLMQDQKDLVTDIKNIEQDIQSNRESRIENTKNLQKEEQKLRDIQNKILELEGDTSVEARNKRATLERQRVVQSGVVEGLRAEKSELNKTYNKLVEKFEKKQDDLELTREELKELDKMKWDYEALILSQLEINAKKGQGLEAIDKELKKLDIKKAKLDEQLDQGDISLKQYQKQNSELNEQRDRLIKAKDELRQINKLAGETVYSKTIHLDTNPSLAAFERRLAKDSYKTLNITTSGGGHYVPGFADGGTHKGGPFIAGEEGFELGKLGSNFEMLNAGLYDRPAGYQVFDHDDSKRILNSLNNIPAYASGVGTSGEADKIVNRLNGQQPQNLQGEAVIYTTVINQVNGREVSREIHKDITEFQNREKEVRDSFAT